MNAGARRGRFLLFAGLYFAQGVPWGFVTVALMLRLTTLGVGPAALGRLASVAFLPWMAKPLVALAMDRARRSGTRWARRRPCILAAELGMAFALLALAFTDAAATPTAFALLLFTHNAFAMVQDVGTDALAIDLLPEHERGRANGFMTTGKFAGVLVGGQGLLAVAGWLGWAAAYAAAVVLVLLPAALVLSLREPAPTQAPAQVMRHLLRLLSRRTVLVAALFAVVVDASDSLLFPLLYPLFTQTLRFSAQQIATLSSLGSAVAAVAGIAGGVLADRFGRRRTIVVGCLAIAGFDVAFVLAHGLWASYPFQLAFAATSAIATGIVYAALLALFMDLARPELPATHFQISMALLNARGAWGSRLGGHLAERLSPRAMFGLGALVEVLPLALLLLLGRRPGRPSQSQEPEDRPG